MNDARRPLLWCGVAVVLAGCVAHPVGPARDLDGYERKATTTLEAALSAVETVRLVAATVSEGDALAAYASVSVSEQEDALGGVRGTFMSIQPPPGANAQRLRQDVSEALTAAFDDVGDVRIVVRRGDLAGLDEAVPPLSADARQLRGLLEELG